MYTLNTYYQIDVTKKPTKTKYYQIDVSETLTKLKLWYSHIVHNIWVSIHELVPSHRELISTSRPNCVSITWWILLYTMYFIIYFPVLYYLLFCNERSTWIRYLRGPQHGYLVLRVRYCTKGVSYSCTRVDSSASRILAQPFSKFTVSLHNCVIKYIYFYIHAIRNWSKRSASQKVIIWG